MNNNNFGDFNEFDDDFNENDDDFNENDDGGDQDFVDNACGSIQLLDSIENLDHAIEAITDCINNVNTRKNNIRTRTEPLEDEERNWNLHDIDLRNNNLDNQVNILNELSNKIEEFKEKRVNLKLDLDNLGREVNKNKLDYGLLGQLKQQLRNQPNNNLDEEQQFVLEQPYHKVAQDAQQEPNYDAMEEELEGGRKRKTHKRRHRKINKKTIRCKRVRKTHRKNKFVKKSRKIRKQ